MTEDETGAQLVVVNFWSLHQRGMTMARTKRNAVEGARMSGRVDECPE